MVSVNLVSVKADEEKHTSVVTFQLLDDNNIQSFVDIPVITQSPVGLFDYTINRAWGDLYTLIGDYIEIAQKSKNNESTYNTPSGISLLNLYDHGESYFEVEVFFEAKSESRTGSKIKFSLDKEMVNRDGGEGIKILIMSMLIRNLAFWKQNANQACGAGSTNFSNNFNVCRLTY